MQTYNDPAKQRSREKLLEFIKKHLSFRKSRDIRVVCFPGAEVDGEEAIEVKEVYDKLGIPRQNIVGLEYNHENAERLRNAGLGIQVIETDADSFFKTTTKQFDIVSLDYCGQQTLKVLETLANIAGRQVLRRTNVVATNFSTKRLSKNTQKLYLRRNLGSAASQLEFAYRARDLGMKFKEGVLEHLEDTFEKRKEESENGILREAREAVSFGLAGSLWRSKYALARYTGEVPPLFGSLDSIIRRATELWIAKTVSNPEGMKESWQEVMGAKTKLEIFGFFADFWFDHIALQTAEKLTSLGCTPVDSVYLAYGLVQQNVGSYELADHKKYQYISNKGEMMYVDMIASEHIDTISPALNSIFRWDRGVVKLNGRAGLHRQGRALQTVKDFFGRMVTTPEYREMLGSSLDRSSARKRISRKDALFFLREGVSPAEIVEAYGGYSLMQLAAMKAHITMGTYDKEKV